MTTSTVKLEIDADTAGIYDRAPETDRSKLRMLWSVLVREYQGAPTTLPALMDRIGERARERGLTAAKLESILNAK